MLARDDDTDADYSILQIQEIGMGKYNWQLFVVVGFGWANDNMWPIVTSLICTSREHVQSVEETRTMLTFNNSKTNSE